jgi:hypothetical protein
MPIVVKETKDTEWICRPDDPYLPDESVNIEDVADGVLVSAISVTGQQIARAVHKARRPRREDDFAIARWFGTYQLTSQALDLPGLPPELADQLVDVLDSDETRPQCMTSSRSG